MADVELNIGFGAASFADEGIEHTLRLVVDHDADGNAIRKPMRVKVAALDGCAIAGMLEDGFDVLAEMRRFAEMAKRAKAAKDAEIEENADDPQVDWSELARQNIQHGRAVIKYLFRGCDQLVVPGREPIPYDPERHDAQLAGYQWFITVLLQLAADGAAIVAGNSASSSSTGSAG
jgi:hypothetical protein